MPSFLDENTVLEVEPIIISIAVVNSVLNILMFLKTFMSGLGESTESNGHVCDDAISGLGGSGLVVVRCLQNMALLIMTKLYNGL
jgi:hypothetical protein